MAAPLVNSTNYAVVDAFTRHLLTLKPAQLTQFYCEICIERLAMPLECQPTSPYQEDTGRCYHCQLTDDVSNPHINTFLNAHGLLLTDDDSFFQVVGQPQDETARLLRGLIPDDFMNFCRNDLYQTNDPQLSWVRYGRKKFKQVYRNTYLAESSRELLQTFFSQCYSAERYAVAPIAEFLPKSVTDNQPVDSNTGSDSVNQPVEPLLGRPMGQSTFARIKTFVVGKLTLLERG